MRKPVVFTFRSLKRQADQAVRNVRALPKWVRDLAYFAGGTTRKPPAGRE